MFTGNIEYIRHIYKVDKALASYTVYGLTDVSNPERIKFSPFIRLEPFRGKSNTSGANLILRGRDVTRWAKKTITGLRPTIHDSIYYGDNKENSKSLLLFQISDSGETLIVDYFNGFYPYNSNMLNELIRNHKFYY